MKGYESEKSIQDREIKISGQWNGRVISDEYPLDDQKYIIMDIDTGLPKIAVVSQSNMINNSPKRLITIK